MSETIKDENDYENQQDLGRAYIRPNLYLDEVIEVPFIRYDIQQENLNDDPC